VKTTTSTNNNSKGLQKSINPPASKLAYQSMYTGTNNQHRTPDQAEYENKRDRESLAEKPETSRQKIKCDRCMNKKS
jgi:hypothetical protein